MWNLGKRLSILFTKAAHHSRTLSYWEGIVRQSAEFIERKEEVRQLNEFVKDTSAAELSRMAAAELPAVESAADEAARSLATAVVPLTDIDLLPKCQLEINAGVGGTEAMLFSAELLEMYRRYADWRGWTWNPLQMDEVSQGGIRSAVISVCGKLSYSALRFEAGVHRVQRIPLTDKSRIHTSTASIAVLPEPEEVSVVIPTSAVTIETMRASGPGGQNVNKRSSAVRVTHKETGIAVHCMEERYQHLNMQIAFKRLAAILMQRKADGIYDKFSSDRKLQVGTRGRAEKIRTFNFKDDRISEHRLHVNYSGIEEFMRGTDHLHSLIESLQEMYMRERISEIINNRVFS